MTQVVLSERRRYTADATLFRCPNARMEATAFYRARLDYSQTGAVLHWTLCSDRADVESASVLGAGWQAQNTVGRSKSIRRRVSSEGKSRVRRTRRTRARNRAEANEVSMSAEAVRIEELPEPEPEAQQHTESRVAKNATTYFLMQLVSWAVTFLSVSLIPRQLGEGGVGVWAFAGSVAGIVSGLLALSIDNFLPVEVGRKPQDAERLLRATFGLRLCILPLFFLGVALTLWLMHASALEWKLAAIQSVISALVFFTDPMRGVHAGREEAAKVSLTDFLLATHPLIALPFLGFGPIALGYALLGMTCVVLLLRANWLRKASIRLRPTFDVPLWRELIRGGSPFYIAGIVMYFYGPISVFALRKYAGTEAVGVYSQAMKLQGAFLFAATALGMALLPSLARLADSDEAHFQRIQNKTLALLITLGMPLTALILILTDPFCHLLYGNKFKDLPLAFQMCGLKMIPLYIVTVMYQFLVARRKGPIWNIFFAGTMLLNGVGCFVLIPLTMRYYNNAAMGATLASLIAECVTVVFALALLKCNPFTAENSDRVFRAALATGAMSAVMWATRSLPILIPAALGGLTFAILAWKLKALGEDEQAKIASLARRALRRR